MAIHVHWYDNFDVGAERIPIYPESKEKICLTVVVDGTNALLRSMFGVTNKYENEPKRERTIPK